jgi:hypothetical protein
MISLPICADILRRAVQTGLSLFRNKVKVDYIYIYIYISISGDYKQHFSRGAIPAAQRISINSADETLARDSHTKTPSSRTYRVAPLGFE